MRLSVVIVNFNTGELLESCLASIEEKFRNIPFQVVLVDNASTDGSEDAARRRKDVILIVKEKNIGFAAGCNAGAQAASGDFILFLNPDTRILSDDIAGLLERFGKNEKAGALGCQNRLPGGEIQTSAYTFPGLLHVAFFVFHVRNLLQVPGLKRVLSAFLKNRFGQFHPHGEYRVTDWVTGAFLLVKRSSWRKVGVFDEGFFLFCEEIDWCLRLKNTGLDVVFDPSFEIEHNVGYSSQKEKSLVLLEKYRSYQRYFSKHHSRFKNFLLKIILRTGVRFWMTVYWIKDERESFIAYKGLAKGLHL